SLLLWNLVLGGYLAAVAFRFRRRRPETFPWALAVMFGISAFYLILVLGPTAPFATLATAPPDGRGPLPLLQNHPLMAAHPPFLYLGFIGFTVPFAFAIAALITGRVSDAWMRITRRWTISAWIFLTIGLVLGALWSYSVLGWGGLGGGPGPERRAPAVADGHRVPALGDGAGAPGDAEGLEPVPDRRDVRADGPRDVPDAGEHPRVGPCVRRVDRGAAVPRVPHAGAARRVRPDRLGARVAARRGDLRHAAVARERLPRQQRPVARAHLHRAGRHDLPAARRGGHRRQGLGRLAVLQPQHGTRRLAAPVPYGDRAAAAVAGGVRLRGPAPPAGPDVGRGGDRRTSRADGRGRRGGDRVRAGGVRRGGDGRGGGRGRPGAAARAPYLDRCGDRGRGRAEPPPLRRARGPPRADRRGGRRVVGRARGPFLGGDDRPGPDRACRGLRPPLPRAHDPRGAPPAGRG